MSKLFSKPPNISYKYIEEYINNNRSNDLLLFKYIYLLCKKYAIENKLNSCSTDKLNKFYLKCSSSIFSLLKDNNNLTFNKAFLKVASKIYNSIEEQDIESEDFETDTTFKNYINRKIESVSFNGVSDISDFSSFINKFMKNIPKKKRSSEWNNIYISVLLSFYKTISFYKDKLFNSDVVIYPKISLYNCDELYTPYITTLVSELIYNLRDSFNKIVSSKRDNIFTLHFKELMNGN